MADEAMILVEISPDLSRFEDQLKRQLESSISKVEGSASATIKTAIEVEARNAAKDLKVVEASMARAEANTALLQQSLTELNASMKEMAKTQLYMARVMHDAFAPVEKQSSALQNLILTIGGIIEAAGAFGQIVSAGIGISKLTSEFVVLSNLKDKITGFFHDTEKAAGEGDKQLGFFGRSVNKVREIGSTLLERKPEEVEVGQILTTITTEYDHMGKVIGQTKKIHSTAFGEIDESLTLIKGKNDQLTKSYITQVEAVTGLQKRSREANKESNKELVEKTKKLFGGVRGVGEAKGKIKGPGTAGLDEFESLNRTIFGRIANFVRQSMHDVDFQVGKTTTGIRDKFLRLQATLNTIKVAPEQLGEALQGFAAIGGVANAIIPRVIDGIGGLISKFNKLTEESGVAKTAVSGLMKVVKTLGPVGVAAAGVIGAIGVGKAFQALAGKASRLQESMNAVQVTLGDAHEPFMTLLGDTTRLGSTQLEVNESITPMIPLLKNAGLSGAELADKLNQLVRRGVDLGSIFNKTSGEVLPALAAALRGEIDPAERLGISFNAAAVEARALANGAQKVDGQLDEQAKTVARLELILERSSFAANDYKNTQDSLANATRNYRAVLGELGFAFSAVFLKGSEKITSAMNKLISTLGPGLERVFTAITPLVDEFGEKVADIGLGIGQEAVEAFISSLTALIPVMNIAVDTLQAMLNTVEILSAVTSAIIPGNISLLQIYFTQWLVGKQVAVLLPVLTTGINLLAAATARLGAVNAAATMTNLAGAIGKLSGPITIAISGLLLLNQRLDENKRKAKEVIDETFTGIEMGSPTGMQAALDALDAQEKALQKKADTAFRTKAPPGSLVGFFDVEFFASDAARKADDALKHVDDKREELQGKLAAQNDLIASIQGRTGETEATILRRLSEAGIDLANIPFNQIMGTANKMITSFFSEKNKQSAEQLAAAFQKTQENLDALISTSSAVQSANSNLANAHQQLASATEAVTDIEKERVRILDDTISEAQELADAEEDLIRIGWRLRDLDQEEAELLKQIQELKAPATADELAAADRRVERAKIALAQATRAEKEALEELNDQGTTYIDLSGLTVDEIRTRLAIMRQSLATQKATERSKKKEGKTQEEIDEEAASNKLNVLDAAQALKDAEKERENIQNRALLNAPQIREAEERLLELGLDRKDATVQQSEAQERLNELKAGETTLSRALADLEERKQDALEAQAAAAGTVAQAANDVKMATIEQDLAQARITGNKSLELDAQIRLLELKAEQAGLDEETRRLYEEQLRLLREQGTQIHGFQMGMETLRTMAPVVLQATTEIGTSAAAGGKAAAAIDAMVAAFAETNAFRIFEQNMEELARVSGTRLPSPWIEGGLIQGVSGPTGQLIRAGERGYSELILPFQRDPMRSANLLARYAPEIASLVNDNPLQASAIGGARMYPARQNYISPNKPSKLEQKLDRLIALQEEANSKPYEINAPITVASPEPDFAARRTAWELKRLLDEVV